MFIFTIILSTLSIIWTIPLLMGTVFRFQLYLIKDVKNVNTLLNKLPKRASIITDGKLRGWIIGMWYIGYICDVEGSGREQSTKTNIYIWTNKSFYEKITTTEIDKNENFIKYYERVGNFFCPRYHMRKLSVDRFNPWPKQERIIESIIEEYRNLNNLSKTVVSILYGEPGSGKSMIPILLAKKMNGSYCDTFDPTRPGDLLSDIYTTVFPSMENPLILVLEEIDIIIDKIHKGIENHKHIPRTVNDKSSWNQFLDRFDRGYYPYLILIMTSNKSPKYIKDIDPSYIRKGRVDISFNI